MDFEEVIANRYSVRKLAKKEIDDRQINQILKAAQIAPTAVNRQPFRIWTLKSAQAKEKAWNAIPFDFVRDAPVIFVVGADDENAWVRPADGYNFARVDAAIAATQMMLEVENLGLGTTWIGHFDPEKLKKEFPQMKPYFLVAVFGVGYPASDSEPSPRHSQTRAIEELVEVL